MNNSCPASTAGPAGLLFTNLIQSLLSSQCLLGNPNDYPMDYGDQFKNNETFDFIVIGAGTAGSVVAGRLAEVPTVNVLLLEAGGNPTPTSDVPQFYHTYYQKFDSEQVWLYETAPNNYSCLSGVNQTCQIAQGKVLGGGTTINAMNFVRGNKQDYEDWKSFGNDGWGFDDVLPYYKKLENYGVDNEYHSSSGPMPASLYGTTPAIEKIKEIICNGYEALGVPRNDDYNGERQTGCFAALRGTLVNGTRANTAKMYLKNQINLKVVKYALVEKIEIVNGSAVGVIFQRQGERFFAGVDKEVILSAGSIRSPQLLMLSGIGPEEELEKHGITSIVNLSGVGKNLQDHMLYPAFGFNFKPQNADLISNESIADAFYEYLQKRTGIFASFLNLLAQVDTLHYSDVPDVGLAYHISHKAQKLLTDPLVFDSATLSIELLHPKSRGVIVLKSADIADNPIIHINFLSESDDLETMIRGIELARNVTKTTQFSVLEPIEHLVRIDACSEFDESGSEYLGCLIRHLIGGGYNSAGTCKMGPSTDPDAVVDNKLKVYGVSNLRVADSSIMPTVTRCTIGVSVIMIGEKAADMIKTDWGII